MVPVADGSTPRLPVIKFAATPSRYTTVLSSTQEHITNTNTNTNTKITPSCYTTVLSSTQIYTGIEKSTNTLKTKLNYHKRCKPTN